MVGVVADEFNASACPLPHHRVPRLRDHWRFLILDRPGRELEGNVYFDEFMRSRIISLIPSLEW